jgi:hypothetical protein
VALACDAGEVSASSRAVVKVIGRSVPNNRFDTPDSHPNVYTNAIGTPNRAVRRRLPGQRW